VYCLRNNFVLAHFSAALDGGGEEEEDRYTHARMDRDFQNGLDTLP
jgi:hypothetical protein